METVECKVWLLVDEDGDYVASADPETLKETYEEGFCELDGTKQTRLVCVSVNIPKPRPVMVAVTVPDMPNDATVSVA